MIDGFGDERLPTVDFSHVDLAGGEQRPEEHRRGVGRWQHGLRLFSYLRRRSMRHGTDFKSVAVASRVQPTPAPRAKLLPSV